MKVILLENVRGTGKKGDLLEVAEGYARNCLFKKNLATEATNGALNELKNAKKSLEYKIEKEKKEARENVEILEGAVIKLFSKSGKSGKLFGAITSKEIASEIKSKCGINIDKRKINLDFDIKAFGTYECMVKLYTDIYAKIKVMIEEG